MQYKNDLSTLQEQFDLGQKIANIGVWILDYNTDNLEWTAGVHHIYGTDPETFQVTFDSFISRVHPEDREKLANEYFTSIEEKRDYEIEHRIVLDDGSIKYLKDRCQNLFDADGNIYRSTGTTLDITKQKLLEDEILTINKNLEKLVEQRTAEQNVLLSLFLTKVILSFLNGTMMRYGVLITFQIVYQLCWTIQKKNSSHTKFNIAPVSIQMI